MNLLALDTARNEGSLALLRDGSLAGFASLGKGPGFGESVFAAIRELLDAHGAALGQLGGVAAATGPGSFTGIRVGLVAAKALAETQGIPVVGVSSLRALARSAEGELPRAALLDARRGELFAGFYDASGDSLRPETVGPWESIEPGCRDLGALLVANEPAIFEPGGPAERCADGARFMGAATLAREIAEIAAEEIAAGRGSLPEAVDANYIRRPDARLPSYYRAARRR